MTDVSVLGDLNGVSQSALTQGEAYVRQLVAENHPERKFGVGSTFYWGLVAVHAQLSGLHLANVEAVVNSLFLSGIKNNPDAVTPELTALALSNYYVSAVDATNATGTLTVIVNRLTSYAVPVGTNFIFNGFVYQNTQAIYAYTNAAQVGQVNDRLLTPRSDGTWQFTVPVRAVTPGAISFVPQGSQLTYENPPSNLVSVEATTDISGGSDTETVADLISRIPDTLAAQTFGSRVSTAALINGQFPGTKSATTGFGDAEMVRDTHNPLGMSTGSMVDVWVNTQPALASKAFTAIGTLLNSTQKLWELQVPATEVAGLYQVTGVRPTGNAGQLIVPGQDIRGYSVDFDADYVPMIGAAIEAGFSPVQTVTVRFTDTLTNHVALANGATQEYEVRASYQPLVQEISNFLTAADRVGPEVNVLVRGAVPCVTSISLNVRLLDADFEQDIDVDGIKSAIINRVYNIGFGYGTLSSSFIMDIIHDYLTGRSDVGATTVTIRGDIVAPNGQRLFLQDDQEIKIPERPDLQVSSKTTVFLTDTSRINIQFTRID